MRSQTAGRIQTVFLVLFCVVYPLSAGPVGALNDRGFVSDKFFTTAYFPLDILADHSAWFSRLYSQYLELFLQNRTPDACDGVF